jgi:hypothetical protein
MQFDLALLGPAHKQKEPELEDESDPESNQVVFAKKLKVVSGSSASTHNCKKPKFGVLFKHLLFIVLLGPPASSAANQQLFLKLLAWDCQ